MDPILYQASNNDQTFKLIKQISLTTQNSTAVCLSERTKLPGENTERLSNFNSSNRGLIRSR